MLNVGMLSVLMLNAIMSKVVHGIVAYLLLLVSIIRWNVVMLSVIC